MDTIKLDKWQEDFIAYKGDKILVAGRQTGKSEAQAYDNAEFAAHNPGTNALLISKTERQSEELLIKTLIYLQAKYPKRIGKGKYKPLKSVVWITHEGHTNKKPKVSRVMCLPTGLAGEGIRSYTIHKLSVDEAQLVEDAVFTAVTPMLLTTGGKISLTGTPQGKRGFFWKAYENKLQQFKVFHVNSEKVIEEREVNETWPEWRRNAGLTFLAQEKARMSPKHYAQEYLGEFIEDLEQLYPDAVIDKVCCLKRRQHMDGNYFLGVDVGRVTDPSTFEIIRLMENGKIQQVDNQVSRGITIPESVAKIKELHNQYKFKQIGIDGGGLGIGIVDYLMLDYGLRNKITDLNNASRTVSYKKGKEGKRTLLKESMHLTLLSLMLNDKIQLLDDDELKASLRSCQVEYAENRDDLKIFGSDTHITEGIIRAVWLANQKHLNLWAAYKGHV